VDRERSERWRNTGLAGFYIDIFDLKWQNLDIKDITTGELFRSPNLTKVTAIGRTDLTIGE